MPSPLTEPRLADLVLPSAPPVVRAGAAPVARRRWPALVLLALGIVLVVGPISTGLFAKVASGQQMIDAFAPHMTPDELGRYDDDLTTLSAGADALDEVYAEQRIPAGKFPGLDEYRAKSAAIDERGTSLLAQIRAAEPDYTQVASIGGFDRVPFLLVVAGLGLAYAGGVLLGGRRQRAGGAVVLALVAATVLIAYPFVSNLPKGSRAGQRLQESLAPIMTHPTVVQQQRDFVVLVTAVGELDTSFRLRTSHSPELATLDKAWPTISSDLASLVGTINDNITNDQALADLDSMTSSIGVSGLVALPWFLVGLGAVSAAAALAARTRPRKALA